MFQRFIEDKRRRRGRFYLALAGGSLVEGGMVVGLIVRSLLTVPELEPPRLLACLGSSCLAPLPPPRSPPPAPEVKKKPRAVPPRNRPPLVQPRSQPVPAAPQEEPASDPGEQGPPGPEQPSGGLPGSAGPPAVLPPPAPPVVKPKFQPVRPHPISAVDPHLPEDIKRERRGQTVEATYKMCVDQAGRVMTVDVVSGVAGADEAIVAVLRGWVYHQQPYPICFIQPFAFVIE